jgi:hypothetical protein
MRGRSREELLDDLQQRATPEPDRATIGVPAAEAFEGGMAELPDLPALPPKLEPDELVGLQAPAGMEPASLPLLVLDAARRARAQLSALLTGSANPWLLDEWQDAVRLAADYPVLADRLGAALGRPAELAVGVSAWSYGGAPGLDVLDHQWEPDPSELARARTELIAAWDLTFEVSGNHLTAADRQLRLDRVGRWHPYSLVEDTWLPAGPADRDPTAALAVPESW